MGTPIVDNTYMPGCFVFGYTLPYLSYFGQARQYPQQAIFGLRPFGGEIPGWNTEDQIFRFLRGAPTPRKTGPWPFTPLMSMRARGTWGKRVIYYQRRGRQNMRRYTPYDGSAKEHLEPWINPFMEAAFLWTILTDENKKRLHADAMRTRQASQGKNYFTKLYIKNDPRWIDYV